VAKTSALGANPEMLVQNDFQRQPFFPRPANYSAKFQICSQADLIGAQPRSDSLQDLRPARSENGQQTSTNFQDVRERFSSDTRPRSAQLQDLRPANQRAGEQKHILGQQDFQRQPVGSFDIELNRSFSWQHGQATSLRQVQQRRPRADDLQDSPLETPTRRIPAKKLLHIIARSATQASNSLASGSIVCNFVS